jgi:hypothetical protein
VMSKPPDAFFGVRLKLKRAWQQLDSLKAEITTFLDDRPYTPAVSFNKQTHRLTVQVHVQRLPDRMWGVRIGEIVHNFRSALDHVAWDLAGRPAARTSKTQFPIFEHEAGFTGRGTEQYLKNVETAAIALIKSEQPFVIREDGTAEGTAQSPLWHLKELSDIDKHRTLHLTGNTLAAHNWNFPKVAQPFTVMHLQEHQGGSIQQDTILWTAILYGATDWPFEKGDIHAGIEVEVAFEDGTPAPGIWGVFGTLAQIGNRVEHILRRIAEDIFKTEL